MPPLARLGVRHHTISLIHMPHPFISAACQACQYDALSGLPLFCTFVVSGSTVRVALDLPTMARTVDGACPGWLVRPRGADIEGCDDIGDEAFASSAELANLGIFLRSPNPRPYKPNDAARVRNPRAPNPGQRTDSWR